jgi:hypothetical protein
LGQSRWDLLSAESAAQLAGVTVAAFLIDVDCGRLPGPARRWQRDDKNRKWLPFRRWRRGEILAAMLRNQTKSGERPAVAPPA